MGSFLVDCYMLQLIHMIVLWFSHYSFITCMILCLLSPLPCKVSALFVVFMVFWEPFSEVSLRKLNDSVKSVELELTTR